MDHIVGNVRIECVEGDITHQSEFDAIVNAANAELRTGGGVAGAIHRAAGPELDRACRPFAPIRPGQAVLTPGFHLPNKHVIHCLGPVYGVDEPSDTLLASCYRRALELADSHSVTSIAFPAISTGTFGFPMAQAAWIAMKTIGEMVPVLKNVRRIRFVLWGAEALSAHEAAFGQACWKALNGKTPTQQL